MSCRTKSPCEEIFDLVKRYFQLAGSNELTITEIIDKMAEDDLLPEVKPTYLTASSLYEFFNHLPENYELVDDDENIGDTLVRFRALLHDPACKKGSKRFCPGQRLVRPNEQNKQRTNAVRKVDHRSMVQDISSEACALVMSAFIALGNADVTLLQLRKFLLESELPNEVRKNIVRGHWLDQFLAERPYLFWKAGPSSYRMYDIRTASLVVGLNNAVFNAGGSVPLTALVDVAGKIDPAMKSVTKLELFLFQYGSLFNVSGDSVTVERKISGFERAVDFLERLG